MDWGDTAQAVTVAAALAGLYYAAKAAKWAKTGYVFPWARLPKGEETGSSATE